MLAPFGASVDFNIIVRAGGIDYPFPLMVDSKIASRDAVIKYTDRGPTEDGLEISTVDVINEIFTKAPRNPVIMYDPNKVSYEDIRVDPETAIKTEAGVPVLPIIEPVAGLTMYKVLARTYGTDGGNGFMSGLDPLKISKMSQLVQQRLGFMNTNQVGLGFSKVVINISDFKPATGRADFESSWHDGFVPFIAVYDPIYTAKNGVLSIIYVDNPLPSGVVPHLIPLGNHTELRESIPFKVDRNVLDVTYQESLYDLGLSTGVEQKSDTTKTEHLSRGQEGYTETTVEDTIYYKYVPDDPDNHLNEQLRKSVVTIKTSIRAHDGSIKFITTSKEIQRNEYFGNLKIGHRKTTKAPVYVGLNASPYLQSVLEEVYTANWITNPLSPGSYILFASRTVTKGLVTSIEE
jgi:hypothetical protein